MLALTGNSEANILTCMTAQELGVSKTVAMVENMDYMNIAGNSDIGTVINKQALTASYIYQMLLNGDVRNIRNLLMVNADIAEFNAFGKAVGEGWGATLGKHFPAMTLVQVSALIDPNAKVEIEAEAILP